MSDLSSRRTSWVALIDGPGPLREAMKKALEVFLPFRVRVLPQDPAKPVGGILRRLKGHSRDIAAAIIHATAVVGEQGTPCPDNGLRVMRMIAEQQLCKVVLFALKPLQTLRDEGVPGLPDEQFLQDYGYDFLSVPLNVIEFAQAILQESHNAAED